MLNQVMAALLLEQWVPGHAAPGSNINGYSGISSVNFQSLTGLHSLHFG